MSPAAAVMGAETLPLSEQIQKMANWCYFSYNSQKTRVDILTFEMPQPFFWKK